MSINTDEKGNNVLDLGMRVRVQDALGSEWVDGVEVDASERIKQVLESSAVRNNINPEKNTNNNSREEFVFTHTNPINDNKGEKMDSTINKKDLFKYSDKVKGVTTLLSGINFDNDYINIAKHGLESVSKLYNSGIKNSSIRKELIKSSVITAGVRGVMFGVNKAVPKFVGEYLPKQVDESTVNNFTTLVGDFIITGVNSIRINKLVKTGYTKNSFMVQAVTGKKTKFTTACTAGKYITMTGNQAYNIISNMKKESSEKMEVKVYTEPVKIEPVIMPETKKPVSKKK